VLDLLDALDADNPFWSLDLVQRRKQINRLNASMQKCQQPVTGVTGVTNLITMGILAVTRAAETCDRCDNPAMRVAAGSVSADPLPFHAPGRNADPHPMMDRPLL
jgi:hypothetical protein